MAEEDNMRSTAFTEEDIEKIESLPEEHKSRIFTALEKHFSKYDDLLKNPPSQMGTLSIPQKDDL